MNITEQKLKNLFDFQKFNKNAKLEKLIKESENRYPTELSDEELSFVTAAGDQYGNGGGGNVKPGKSGDEAAGTGDGNKPQEKKYFFSMNIKF